jgi:hypothetical protein
MMMLLLTTVASIHSGDYPLASSAAVNYARVVYASASEDIKTMDTMDDDTNVALDCLIEDNYFDVISNLLYDLHVRRRSLKRDCGRD